MRRWFDVGVVRAFSALAMASLLAGCSTPQEKGGAPTQVDTQKMQSMGTRMPKDGAKRPMNAMGGAGGAGGGGAMMPGAGGGPGGGMRMPTAGAPQ